MRFKELIIENYRQYYGRNSIRFAAGKEANITLINGPNGAGKTNLFEAINWCLYGDYDPNRGPIVSKEKAIELNYGENAECSVSIWFEHEGKEYVAIRKSRATKIKQDGSDVTSTENEQIKYKKFSLKMLPVTEDDFKVFRSSGRGMEEIKEPTIMIDRSLPHNARQYFLFDGEKIDKLSKPEHDNEVREAVKNVLQLPSILRACEHLESIKKEILRVAKRSAKDVDEEKVLKLKEEIDLEIEKAKKEIKDCSDKLIKVRELKNKVDADLRKYSSIKELTRRRDDLQDSHRSCEKRILDVKNRISDQLSNSHLIMSDKLVGISETILEERRKKGHIPPGIRESFIKDLIEAKLCICGNDLSEGTEGRKLIEQFLTASHTDTKIAEEISEIIGDLNTIKQVGRDLSRRINKDVASWLSFLDELEDIAGKLEDVHNQIKKVGDTDISSLEKARRSYEEDERNILGQQAKIDWKMKELFLAAKEVEKHLKTVSKNKGATGKLVRMSKLTELAIDVLHNTYEEFANEKRKEIEDEMKKIFYRLIWKKEQFPDVRLTEDYSLQLFDRYGSPARAELSAGERQVLSLSFITAMAFVTGGKIPLIMDTPFGRLFSEHRINICREIPDLTNQWVLLVQDEEVSKETLDVLLPRVGAQYSLIFDQGCTRIEEV